MACLKLTYRSENPFLKVVKGSFEADEKSSAGRYRFGFNGAEKIDEIYGDDNGYDLGARMYNPRLGKMFSTDPLKDKYPELSTYQFASNTPIAAIDLDGLEPFWYSETRRTAAQYKSALIIKGYTEVKMKRSHHRRSWIVTGSRTDYDGVLEVHSMKFSPGGKRVPDEREKFFTNTISTFQSSWDDTPWNQHDVSMYRPPQIEVDAVGITLSGGVSGVTSNGDASIGLSVDRYFNGGVSSGFSGGGGLSSPGLDGSVSFDFYNFGGEKNLSLIEGTSVTKALQLGIISFSFSQSSDKDTPLKPNGDINKFSIGLGFSGFGVKEKIDYSKYIGTSKTNKNDIE